MGLDVFEIIKYNAFPTKNYIKCDMVRYALILILFFLIGCAGNYYADQLSSATQSFEPGDSREKVTDKLGQPGYRQFDQDVEILQYCATRSGLYHNHQFYVFFFRNDILYKQSFYRKNGTRTGNCKNYFERVDQSL